MDHLREIIDLMNSKTNKDIELVSKAFTFAESVHNGQLRFSGDPYFVHVRETAKILAELGMSSTTIAAGLLHDCIEDGKATREEVEDIFGKEILFLVEGVTKLGKLKYRGAERHNESLRKLFVAVSQDIRVIIIKLSDRLHNMQTLEYVPKHKQKRIAEETLEIYVPLAYRLGIRKLSRPLEDYAFPFVYPEEYKKTKELLKTRNKEQFHKLDQFQKSIKKVLAKENITEFTVDYRMKTLYSLYKKLVRKDWNIEKIYDISALRIIVRDVEECYRVLGIVHSTYRPLPGRIKDYIAFPKPNGYKALHTTIFTGYGNVVEIQIKTKQMHQESEYGIASHVGYKENTMENFSWIKKLLPFKNVFSEQKEINFEDVPSWIKDLVEFQKTAGLEDEIKSDFFQQRIFVFTPKGDVIDLPINSTPIDFAYAIHSSIGDHIGGAKINGKMVSIGSTLNNGDIVEIVTKKQVTSNKKWLNYVKTVSAKKHIKAAITKTD